MSSGSGFPRGRSAVVGAATFGVGKAPGFEAIELAARASLLALADAGLTPADVDAVFIAQPQDTLATLSFCEYMGIDARLTDNNRSGGSAFLLHLEHAALALDAGLCQVALIAYGSNQATASGALVQTSKPSAWETPYQPLRPITGYALATARHMHQYGTTRHQLAEVAVAARRWAQLNPEASAREPLDIATVLGARMVCDPLSVRDCCLVTDGAAAVVMVRADQAPDRHAHPVYLLAAAAAVTHGDIAAMPDLTLTGAALSGPRAFAQAGLQPADIDVLQLYDAFTINPILFLEDLGYCAKGEGGAFVEGGRIAPGGALPVNTSGGGLSYGHPGMFGLFTIVESVRQLRGECGARQVAGARLALAHGNGGILSSQATAIFGTAETL
ncbi:acetyl-CoA acetyltransferase [Aquabacterium sp.]|uniref:acetyl-CoA acetyltransferase n=1 Tax=Aquabacterium sp. TaxID=1872578 RepID=UPI002CBD01F6|nr:acetyl-CoA acetyltransferase [Aquabacterium sp.]HSW06040.1 acetyl-CoA acetyltransferase [Aquabacterium sp.]